MGAFVAPIFVSAQRYEPLERKSGQQAQPAANFDQDAIVEKQNREALTPACRNRGGTNHHKEPAKP